MLISQCLIFLNDFSGRSFHISIKAVLALFFFLQLFNIPMFLCTLINLTSALFVDIYVISSLLLFKQHYNE